MTKFLLIPRSTNKVLRATEARPVLRPHEIGYLYVAEVQDNYPIHERDIFDYDHYQAWVKEAKS